MSETEILLLGQVLDIRTNPFETECEASARFERRGAVLVKAGRIASVGPADALRAAHPRAAVADHGEGLILPGFVDAHAHYPQTAIIASWGKRLIDWLETYTFPEEMRFIDPDHAAKVAALYLDLLLAHGFGRDLACRSLVDAPLHVDVLGDHDGRLGLSHSRRTASIEVVQVRQA